MVWKYIDGKWVENRTVEDGPGEHYYCGRHQLPPIEAEDPEASLGGLNLKDGSAKIPALGAQVTNEYDGTSHISIVGDE